MNKILLIAAVLAILTSCTKNLTSINQDPNQFTSATPEALLETAFKKLNDYQSYGIFKEGANQVYVPRIGGRYDVSDATLGGSRGSIWQHFYTDVLQNVQQVFVQYGSDSNFVNRIQIARIWQAYTYSILTGLFGPCPWSQANNLNYLTSVDFDSEDSVYTRILANLKDAASKINLNKTNDKLNYDVVYGGDLLKWKKFANTLRLKIALRCQRNLGTVATQAIRDVMTDEANTISSEADAAKMGYENISGNENAFWRDEIKVNPVDLPKLTDYFLVYFRSTKDPRLNIFYDSTAVANRAIIQDTLTSTKDDSMRVVTYPVPYFGSPKSPTLLTAWNLPNPQPSGVPGSTKNSAYSNVAANIFGSGSSSTAQAVRPVTILGYSETLLLKAEAAMLGLGGSLTPDAYYYAAIDANFAYWTGFATMPTSSSVAINNTARDAYKASQGIKWGTSLTGFNNYTGIVNFSIPTDNMFKIYLQLWLTYWPDQSFDFWCLQRRTQFLSLPPHTNPSASFSGLYEDLPLRASYPTSLGPNNTVGYNEALKMLNSSSSTDEVSNPYIQLHFETPFTPINWNAVSGYWDMRFLQKWYGSTIESLRSAAAGGGFSSSVKILSTYKQ